MILSIHLFFFVYIAYSSLLCFAAPTGLLKSHHSKGVVVKDAPRNASLNDQVVHHIKEGLNHEKQAKGLFRSKISKQAHHQAALSHQEKAKKLHNSIESYEPYGVEGIYHS